jgi:hypothetical protein
LQLIGLEHHCVIGATQKQLAGRQKKITGTLDGDTSQVQQQEQQSNVLIHRLQQPVQGPGRQKKQHGREQIDDETDPELPCRSHDIPGGCRGVSVYDDPGTTNRICEDVKYDVNKIQQSCDSCGFIVYPTGTFFTCVHFFSLAHGWL